MDRGLHWVRGGQREGGEKETRCEHRVLLWLQSGLGVIPCDQMIGFMQPPATGRLDWSGVTLALLQTGTEADHHPDPDPDLPLASQLSR